ncbi:DUF6069 family protein [Streptomyces sp. NPDC002588]|uniref:DUF6069 family protein n=1 Tax=Streptomyces sp. NPDC002588 TaxID=3154419 RepID=UPI00332B84D1
MSAVSEKTSVRPGPLVVVGGVLGAIALSSLADALIAVLARAAGAPDDFRPLEPGSYIFLTVLGVVAGAAGWAVVRKVSADPERLIRWLAPVLVAVSFVPDFLLLGDGGVKGVAALLAMHVVVAVIAVAAYRRVMPLGATR